ITTQTELTSDDDRRKWTLVDTCRRSTTIHTTTPKQALNRPAFDAHLHSWEGACRGEQVRPGDAGQGCPSGVGAPGRLSERMGGDHRSLQAAGGQWRSR